MMNKCIVDTNVLIYYWLEAVIDINQSWYQVISKLKKLSITQVMITTFIATELDIVLDKIIVKRYKLSKDEYLFIMEKYKQFISDIRSRSLFYAANTFHVEEGHDLQQKFPKLSLTDCMLLSMAQEYQVPILTADKRIVFAASKIGVEIV